MARLFKRPIVTLGLCWLLAGYAVAAQNPAPPTSTPDEQRALVKPDPKRAKKLAEIGAQLEATGNYGGALEAYEEAARYAPFDVTIVSKSVALRSRLVRGYIDDGERLAIQGENFHIADARRRTVSGTEGLGSPGSDCRPNRLC